MEKLNEEALRILDDIVQRHQNERGPVIVMLHEVQDQFGYIPFEAMDKIAHACHKSVAEVYGVVCFYAGFTTQPKGRHVINICLGTACYVKGSQALIDEAIKKTGAKMNGTSEDGLFSLDATRCVGACGLAPVCVVDGKVLGKCSCKQLDEEIHRLYQREKGEQGNEQS